MIRKAYSYTCLLLILLTMSASAQTQSEKLSVFIEITSFSDSTVSLAWQSDNSNSTNLSRKKMNETAWTTLATNYTSTTYTDSTVEPNVEYEYQLLVTNTTNSSIAYGYISFGANIATKQDRGNLLIVVDDRFTTSLKAELIQLQMDAISDGYTPITITVNKDESVTSVKTKIDANTTPSTLSGIYLIGHVPVPQSGAIAPDGHGDHRGAWATDLYYASPAAEWTDNSTNYTNASDTSLSNVPGDGKFDNYRLLGETNCPISRIDFYDLPGQANSELDMLKNYLAEASRYKHGKTVVKEAGLIDNQLINFSEGFAGNGYRNFKSLMGDSITVGNMMTNLTQETYKWTYAVSYGSDTAMANIASITDLKNTDYKGIFSMVMGSYFGDWNKRNNFMRSLLADGKMLTTCWAGRPNWFVHHMGLNNPIGLSAKRSAENGTGRSPLNTSGYDAVGIGQNQIHISLLGDLTLRQNYLPSISDFTAKHNKSDSITTLTWNIPETNTSTAILLYKSLDSTSGYTLLTTLNAYDTTFVDSNVTEPYHYYIKYTQLDTTLSGSYYNNSLGVFLRVDTTGTTATTLEPVPAELIRFTSNKVRNTGQIEWTTATEQNVSHFELQRSEDATNWETISTKNAAGNSTGNIDYKYTDYNLLSGINYYRLRTIDFDGYTEISHTEVLVNSITDNVSIYPNPSTSNTVRFDAKRILTAAEYDAIEVLDMSGNTIMFSLDQYNNEINIDARKGIYYIRILNKAQRVILI